MHFRDIAVIAYSSHGSPSNKGSVSYLLEDSWPRLYINLGWWSKASEQLGIEVVLSVSDKSLDFGQMIDKELNGLVLKVRENNGFIHLLMFGCFRWASKFQKN